MGLISGIWLFILGVLGASNLIIARKPDAKELIAKLAPYQGWIGASSAIWGVWRIIWALLHLNYIKYVPVLWVSYLANAVIQAALGLLLGMGVLRTFIKNPQAVEKMNQTAAKLAPKQGVLGLIAIGLGIWTILSGFIWRYG